VPGDFDTAWAAFEAEVGPILVDAVSAEAPVDTGQLANETQDWQDDNGELQIISTDDRGPIAKFMMWGTVAHDIVPVNATALHFIGGDGSEVFTQHVSHPGTAPNPYPERAWENVKDEVLARFKQTVGIGLALAYLNPRGADKIEL